MEQISALRTCDRCGLKQNLDLHNDKILGKSFMGILGTFCEGCIWDEPDFCTQCWEWSRNPYDTLCKSHDEWYLCHCGTAYPMIQDVTCEVDEGDTSVGLSGCIMWFCPGCNPIDMPGEQCQECGEGQIEPKEWG